ncbi:MAG TPA: hypothetical protein VGM41_14185 [Chitinophagaceae bacterium]
MKPFLLVLLSCLCYSLVFPQASDFIVVKKHNNRTIKSFFTGLPITLETTYESVVSGYITDIRNDSVFVKEYDVKTVPTMWGVTMLDTASSYIVGVHYKEIKKIDVGENDGAFQYVTNGTIFLIGGVGYGLLNVVNGAYLHESITDSKNARSLSIAGGVAVFGFILNRIAHHKNKYWKYVIEYVHMKDVKKQLRGF